MTYRESALGMTDAIQTTQNAGHSTQHELSYLAALEEGYGQCEDGARVAEGVRGPD